MSEPFVHRNSHSPLVGMVKPSRRPSKSYAELLEILPADVRTCIRHAPVEHGSLEEFSRVLPAYRALAEELVAEGADLVHLEGTPPFLIVGYEKEQRIVQQWASELGRPVFTSAMSQANALRALGVTRLLDAGYDPTTGPHAERYFSDAGFDVLCVEKVAIDWGGEGDLADEDAFEMLSRLVRRHPEADGLCLQGSSKWRLSSVIPRLEDELGIPIVHPVAARYWELMARLGRPAPRPGLGRLLSEMPPHPLASDA